VVPRPADSGLIVSNPPYGVQSAPKSASVSALMNDFASNLKKNFGGWTAWLLSADLDLPRQMHLKETRRTVLFNGALECRLFRFELVAGGYRRSSADPAAAGR
jgi:putative N6-adenine-specific DNA methylase